MFSARGYVLRYLTGLSTIRGNTVGRIPDDVSALRRMWLTAALTGAIVLLGAVQSSPPVVPVAAQTVPGLNCDGTACIIWGIGVGNQLLRINTCTGAVAIAPIAGAPAGLQTVAAAPVATGPQPNLTYGTAAGAQVCTSGFPPLPAVPCGSGIAPGAIGLARDG